MRLFIACFRNFVARCDFIVPKDFHQNPALRNFLVFRGK